MSAQAVDDYDALRRMVPKFRAGHAWLRDADDLSYRIGAFVAPGTPITKCVRRDYAVCALANKGCNTHASVRMLTDAGNGDDAMVLTRALLETAVVFRWMMIDPAYRLDLYGLSSALSQRHWAHLVQQHFSDQPDLVAKAQGPRSPRKNPQLSKLLLEMFNTGGRGNDSPMASSSSTYSMECSRT